MLLASNADVSMLHSPHGLGVPCLGRSLWRKTPPPPLHSRARKVRGSHVAGLGAAVAAGALRGASEKKKGVEGTIQLWSLDVTS